MHKRRRCPHSGPGHRGLVLQVVTGQAGERHHRRRSMPRYIVADAWFSETADPRLLAKKPVFPTYILLNKVLFS